MANPYYSLPINFDCLTSLGHHSTCSLKQSIAQHIHLIATSYFGDCKFDESFGCAIWDFDFDNSMTELKLRDKLKKNIQTALTIHEPRLQNIDISVFTTQVSLSNTGAPRIKNRIDVSIKARLTKTNDLFEYYEFFFLGPLSYY